MNFFCASCFRISVVFRVRSAARVRITDIDLIKRLGLIIAVFVFYLIVRAVVSPPRVIVAKTLSGLKAEQCSYDWWDYAANIGEYIESCFVLHRTYNLTLESWSLYRLHVRIKSFEEHSLCNVFVLLVVFFLLLFVLSCFILFCFCSIPLIPYSLYLCNAFITSTKYSSMIYRRNMVLEGQNNVS